MVCELDGPTPILKRSRTLINIKLPVKIRNFREFPGDVPWNKCAENECVISMLYVLHRLNKFLLKAKVELLAGQFAFGHC
jgi:hypothetical protein